MLSVRKQQVLTTGQLPLYNGSMQINALERAIGMAGSQAELARRIGKKQAHVWNWLHRDKRVPADMVLKIESATGGEVSRHELRPDLYPLEPAS